MKDFMKTDATELARSIRLRSISPLEAVDAAIEQADAVNGRINAIIHERFDAARREARDLKDLNQPFAGVPLVLKDYDGAMAGEPFHGGMNYLKRINFHETTDSHMVRRFKQAGFIIIGKTNTPELGLMGTTEPLSHGITHNPWKHGFSVGGSSGGSGAAVASGIVPVAHGGDGGGSIRIPASMNGLVGLKPTRGRVSLGPLEKENWAGVVARHVLVRSVRDSARILDILAGEELGDPYTAVPPETSFSAAADARPAGLRIGVMTTFPGGAGTIDPQVVSAVEVTARALEELGHRVEVAHPPALDDLSVWDVYPKIVGSWVAWELSMWERRGGEPIRESDIEPTTWDWARLGRKVSAEEYIDTIDRMQEWAGRVQEWWADFDLLLTPTITVQVPEIGSFRKSITPDNPLGDGGAIAAFTVPFNVTGQPGISLPVAMSDSGLPIGAMLTSRQHREDLLLGVSRQLEEASSWRTLAG